MANLCYLPVWSELFALLKAENHYLLAYPPSAIGPIVGVSGMLALAALLYAGIRIARRGAPGGMRRRFAAAAFLLVVAVAANGFWQQVANLSWGARIFPQGRTATLLLFGVAAIACAGAWRTFGLQRLARAASTVVLVLLPFVVLTLGQAASLALWFGGDSPAFTDKPAAPLLTTDAAARRVLFVVFDSLDQQILVDERPAGLVLEEFDRLTASAVQWQNAYPPSDNTLMSLPTLINGKPIVKVRRTAANELGLHFADGGPERPWSKEPNLFTRARSLDLDAVLVGWYHPYCRVIGDHVTRCRWHPQVPQLDTLRETLRMHLALLTLVMDTMPGVARLGVPERIGQLRMRKRQWHAAQYRAIHAEALRAAIDERIELVFIHYPVPHTPFIFDRTTGSMRVRGRGTYADDLALTDLTLKELRLALEGAGLSERTALIVTSDHWRRRPGWKQLSPPETFPTIGRPDHRVPLIVRLAGQREPVVLPRPIHSAAAYELALAILAGTLETPAQVATVVAALPRWMRLD